MEARTSEHWENGHLARSGRVERRRDEEPGNPERILATYATAYYRLIQNFAKVKTKRDTKVALRGQVPRGVSSDHVLSWAFGDALYQT